jgi:hypothetical protein
MRVQGMRDQDMKDQVMAQGTKAQDMRDHDTMVSLAVAQCETPTHCLTPAQSKHPAVTAQPNSHRLVPRQIPRFLGCLRRSIVFLTLQFPPTTTHQRSHRNPLHEHSRKSLPCGCLYQPRERHLMHPLLTLLSDLRGVVPRFPLPIPLPHLAGGPLTTPDLLPEYLSPAH